METNLYFDNAATTFPKPEEVYDFMDRFYREFGVNAGRGSYKSAKRANELIEETRVLIAELVHQKEANRVIFTPSATIAINQILHGLCWENIQNVYITNFEHNAIIRTLHHINKKHNFDIHIIPFDYLTFDLEQEQLKIDFAKNNPDLILISHISNVTGYILPIETIINESEQYNSIKLLDCAQSLGLVGINLQDLDIDFTVFAGHKSLYGPFGIAGYIDNYKKGKLKPFIIGGTGSDSQNLEMPEQLPYKAEAGSYNIHAIAGLNAALKWLKKTGTSKILNHEKKLSNLLVERLKDNKQIELYIPKDIDRHIGTISFNINQYHPNDIAEILDEEFNILVRAGHHCAPLIGKFLGGLALKGTVRVSIGYFNTEEEVLLLAKIINKL